MRCPFRVRASTLRLTLTLLALCTAGACASGNPEEATAAGTAGAGTPFVIEVAQTYITIENRTGAPLAGGQMEIIPRGVLPPFKSTLPRLENGARRDIMLNTFRAADGTLFNRNLARARTVKVTAKDQSGKEYAFETPFE